MKSRMTDDDATALAVAFVSGQDLRGWRYAPAGVTHTHPGVAAVIFETFSPEGNLVDGPAIVLVDVATRGVRFFESP